jgi:diguanylate cyclase (GGDEF)-like protein
MFSVPFYQLDGKLAGSVTAIILNSAIRNFLPNENFALINSAYSYVSQANPTGQENASASFVIRGEADPRLIYSETIPLDDSDPRSQWVLWAGLPNAAFANGPEAQSARNFEIAGYGAVMLLTLTALACWMLALRNYRLTLSASQVLERRVEERTAEIRHMATHDGLTGLPNRTVLFERTEEALTRVRRGELLAVLALDLDGFKSVNDTLGHPIGDSLLREVTERLRSCIREIDTAARLGGDEFVVLQADVKGPEEAGTLAQRIVERITGPFEVEGHQIVVGISIGIAMAPIDGTDGATLLRNADIALYRAKLDARGTYRYFEPEMDKRLQERRALELALRHAVVAGEFVLHYQPLVDVTTEAITGFEALLRWNHPERGLLAPGEFIVVAEEIGAIIPIGDWVIQQACADAAKWPSHLKLAVNLSPIQFKGPSLLHTTAMALDKSGLAPSRLEFEITESVLLTANPATLTTLHQMRSLGIRIAMDDFGTGYSSLSYLRSFPFDKIKIDRSFVSEAANNGDSIAIVRAVATLGSTLGMTTTAEGIETYTQLESVRAQGCVEVQGYLFSRPVPREEIPRLLRERFSVAA